MLGSLLSFAISLLIGLMVGMERERSHPEGIQAIGVRTFILFALLGTLVATLSQALITLTASAFVFSLILASYLRSTSKRREKLDIGITTEIAAGLIFCLGYLIPSHPLVAIIISAMVLLVLIERHRLHILARQKFKPHEIEIATILIVFALGILPILPNQPIDPWDLFNPRKFGILIATVAAIQFMGYLAIHLFGHRFGIAIMGFLGGLISSTIVFAMLPGTLKQYPKQTFATLASSIFAVVAMLIEVIIIIFVASPRFFTFTIWPIFVMIVIGVILAMAILNHQKTLQRIPLTQTNAINILSILRTSLLMALMFLLIAIVKRLFGVNGIYFFSFLSGLLEIHGITLATSLLYTENQLTITDARSVVYLAIFATFISKFFLLWSLTPARFALKSSLLLFILLIGGTISYWLSFQFSLL